MASPMRVQALEPCPCEHSPRPLQPAALGSGQPWVPRHSHIHPSPRLGTPVALCARQECARGPRLHAGFCGRNDPSPVHTRELKGVTGSVESDTV